MKITRFSMLIVCLILAFPSIGVSADRILKKSTVVSFSDGYIDSRFAISPSGSHLAYITVNTDGKSILKIKDLAGGSEKTSDISKFTAEPLDMRFSTDSAVLLVSREGKRSDLFDFGVFGTDAVKKGEILNVSDLLSSNYGGKKTLTAYTLTKTGANQAHVVDIYDISNLRKPTKSFKLNTDVRGRVAKPETFDIAYFSPDYMKIYVKVIGKYDKKTDSKLPDTNGVWDMEKAALVKGIEISNNSLWDKDSILFAKFQGLSWLIRLNGVATQTGTNGSFEVGSGIQSWKKINPDFNLGRFEFSSLKHQRTLNSTGEMIYSMLIDPQNPYILKQMKSEKRYIHFFTLNGKTGASSSLGAVMAGEDMIRWSVGGNYVAVMRLHKNWTIGNTTLEIYKIK